ncbi:hypothetical protein [Leisingera sp. M658]|uniref:hypothetical protein n=1 Tax=Leisingera sp. M658 TaxID=2867015 RepID=UPI0021A8C220|nr:hypothetical protein [Leisingera sp. M658]UWQ73600.1 hypothetical protein K3724_13700 [Leisingera sp. M658]
MRKKQLSKEKKAKPKPRPKNRYMRNAKLSEYKFLKILRGFADDVPAKNLAETSGISEKTIRATYRVLRRKLFEGVVMHRHGFGNAGFYLLRNGRVEDKGKRFLQGVVESEIFTRHIERHAPRLSDAGELQNLMFEVSTRVFCNISMRDGALIDYPPDVRNALEQIRDIGKWIRANINQDGFLQQYGHVIERFKKLSEDMKLLLEKEELLSMRSRSRAHHYPSELLYRDLRRFLLKHPINQS